MACEVNVVSWQLFIIDENNTVLLDREYSTKADAMEMLSFYRGFFPDSVRMQIFYREEESN